MADLILPRGEMKVLQAEDKDYIRGLLVKLLDEGGYKAAYWYNKPNKPYPVEVLVDGKSIKKDAKVVEFKFHPKDYYDKIDEARVYVKPQFAKAIDKAINQNKSISDKPGKLDSSLKVLKKIGKAYNHSLPLGFQWLWLKHNLDLLTPYQVKYFNRKKGTSAWKRKGSGEMAGLKENKINEMRSLKQLLSKVKSGRMDKKISKKLDNLVTRGDGFVVITKSKKDGYNRFHANQVDDRGIDVVPHSRDFKPGKVRGMMRHKPEHLLGDINWKDVKDMYMENTMKEARGTCWVGYKQVGMKKKNGRMVPNCVKEDVDIYYEENGKGYGYTFEFITDKSLQEAEYQGRKVKLNKIMQGDAKKFKVYVKNPKGNVVKVNFGQGGKAKGGTMRIRKSNPDARKNFRARHNCDNPGPKHKARYWACRTW